MPDGVGTIDTVQYDRVYLIILNLNRAEEIWDCRFMPYSVEISKGEIASAPDEIFQAEMFEIPEVESLTIPRD